VAEHPLIHPSRVARSSGHGAGFAVVAGVGFAIKKKKNQRCHCRSSHCAVAVFAVGGSGCS